MDRRSFIRLGAVGAVTAIIIPETVLAAQSADALDTPLAGGIYYTRNAPGRWSEKVGGHLPRIEKQAAADGKLEIQVVTPHEMKGFEHYIVKHILLDEKFRFIDEKMFDPQTETTPVSHFTLENYQGPLYAVSVCNKHDSWVNVIDV